MSSDDERKIVKYGDSSQLTNRAVDLKITLSQNVPSHHKIMINGEGKYVLMKRVIMHATTAKITMTIRYMHLWHICLAMTNVQVKSMVTVRN